MLTFSMDEIATFQVNSPSAKNSILIGTQGSDFKDKITSNLIEYYGTKDVYLNVMDVSVLPEADLKDYDAIIVIHTWEYGSAPDKVKKFLHKNSQIIDKIVVLSTSGDGTNKIQGIDAFTGESIMENSSVYSKKIISKVDPLLSN